MAELTLVTESADLLKPIVEAALTHELGLLEVSIRQTEQRLRTYERKYVMSTQDFLARYEDDQFEETLDFAEWIGESRLLERLRDKVETLRGIHFAN